MVGNFFKVLGGGFFFVFIHAKDIVGLFLLTLVVYVVIGYSGLLLTKFTLEASTPLVILRNTIDVLLVIIRFLALMPLYVSVTRLLVLDEKPENKVLGRMREKRVIRTFVAWSMFYVLFTIPILIAGIINYLLVYTGLLGDQVVNLNLGLGPLSLTENVLYILGIIIGLWLAIRASMMPIASSLDEDFSVHASFDLTRHHIWFTVVSVIGLLVMISLVSSVVLHLFGTWGGLTGIAQIWELSFLGLLGLIVAIAALDMWIGMTFTAGLVKVHEVLKGDKKVPKKAKK